MRDYFGLHWARGEAKVRRYSTTSGAKAATIKIELEVTSTYALSNIVRDLEEAMRDPVAAAASPPPRRSPSKSARLALPAPLLRLPPPELGGDDDR